MKFMQYVAYPLHTTEFLIIFKIRFFLVETIGGVCILLHTHEVRKTNLQCQVCRQKDNRMICADNLRRKERKKERKKEKIS